MNDITIHVSLGTSLTEREDITAMLRDYNRHFTPNPDWSPLTIEAKHADKVVGGLLGKFGHRWLFVDILVVAEGYRKARLGSRLLEAAEAEARNKNCVGVYLDTYEFQARGFYEKHGYSVFGTQENYPPNYTRFFMQKLF
jgi:GNAT superfamily N-acetyltransferase